jgi:hypothetical protein
MMNAERGTMNDRQLSSLHRSAFRVSRSSCIPLCLLFCLLLFVTLAQASPKRETRGQSCPSFDVEQAEREFAAAAARHQGQFRELLQSRGMSSREADGSDIYLDDLKASLAGGYPKETAVLFYAEELTAFRVWLVDREGVRAFHSAVLSREQLEAAIAALRESLDVENLEAARLPPRLRPKRTAPPSAVKPRALLGQRLSALTNLLLPDGVACALSSVRNLIIVPVLNLGTVPFAALRPFNSSSSLIDRMSVTIAPSLADINQDVAAWDARFSHPLLVGNPYLAPGAGWQPLLNAEREALMVARMFKTTPLNGREATRATVLKRAAEADLLYFATHGAADAAQPLEGGFLVFSGPAGAESLWTAREIQRSSLKARLAVLSACQTGLGRAHDAGIIGLARSFQLAGVPRVVMSLWSVYDDATSELMQAFARHLRAHPPAEALRQAMLEVRRRRPDPTEWASFVIFGTPL